MVKEHVIPYKAFIPGDNERPMLSIGIDNIGLVHCILDSGADYCTFPEIIGLKAGIEVKKGKVSRTECAHGELSDSYVCPIKLNIFGEYITVDAVFVKDGKEPALIGRKGIFDKFRITFEESKKQYRMKRL